MEKQRSTIEFFQPHPGKAFHTEMDLNRYLISHKAATFFARVESNNYTYLRIDKGDLLIADRSKTPNSDDIIIGLYEGEFIVTKIHKGIGGTYIFPDHENPTGTKLDLTTDTQLEIWGVVTYIIHKTQIN